jgi:hypothetical protein
VLAALVSGLSISALIFQEFHPAVGASQIGEGFLCSSAITAVVSAVLATMLLFMFEGVERARRIDLAIAWSPLILLDLSIIEFLVGMVCWYYDSNSTWQGVLMATQLVGLLGFYIVVATWMWNSMSQDGGLGKDERETVATSQRSADG